MTHRSVFLWQSLVVCKAYSFLVVLSAQRSSRYPFDNSVWCSGVVFNGVIVPLTTLWSLASMSWKRDDWTNVPCLHHCRPSPLCSLYQQTQQHTSNTKLFGWKLNAKCYQNQHLQWQTSIGNLSFRVSLTSKTKAMKVVKSPGLPREGYPSRIRIASLVEPHPRDWACYALYRTKILLLCFDMSSWQETSYWSQVHHVCVHITLWGDFCEQSALANMPFMNKCMCAILVKGSLLTYCFSIWRQV